MSETTTKLQPGDIVQLKSGGPAMTLEKYSTADRAYCQWFDGTKLKRSEFDTITLQRMD